MQTPIQINRFQKTILLIVQYKYLKSCSKDFFLKNQTKIWSSAQDHAVLHLLLNTVGFFFSTRQKSAWQKWIVPQLYQLPRGILEGPALQYYIFTWFIGSGAWSRCGWKAKNKSSRFGKDSWYQDYLVLLTSAPPLCHWQPSAFVPEIARNVWKQAASILVERIIHQNIEVLLFW